MDVLKVLEKPAFRTSEFAAALAESGRSPGYARLALHRLGRKGKIIRVRRGWWALPESLPEEIACAMSAPCYVSFHSALYCHGLTTQIPSRIQLAVAARKPRKYVVLGTLAQEYGIPKRFFRGYAVRSGQALALPEKAFADCLLLPRSCPDAILVEALPGIDGSKTRAYCNRRMLGRLKKIRRQAERGKGAGGRK